MKRLLKYTHAQLKRVLHYLPFVLPVTVVLSVCLAIFLVTTANVSSEGEENEKIRVGVVGSFEDSYLSLGVSALKSFDSSRFSIEILELNESEAEKSLKNGELAGYVLIPDGFVENALRGDVGKISFVTMQTNLDIINMFKQETLDLVSTILVESQNGVYGLEDALREYGAGRDELSSSVDKLAIEYVSLILSRSNAVELQVIGVSNNLTFAGYMFSGISILLMLLAGIVTSPLYVRHDTSLYRLLSANGNCATHQVIGEYLSFFLIMLLNNSTLLFALMTFVGKSSVIPELSELGTAPIILILLKFIPAIALIVALQFLMYQLSSSIVSGVLIQFVSSIFLGYISGCLYPISFFPKAIRALSVFTPPGIVRSYLATLLTGGAYLTQLAVIILYTLALVALSVFVRHKKINAV